EELGRGREGSTGTGKRKSVEETIKSRRPALGKTSSIFLFVVRVLWGTPSRSPEQPRVNWNHKGGMASGAEAGELGPGGTKEVATGCKEGPTRGVGVVAVAMDPNAPEVQT
ncbi:unnamed protein product, partial [Discosporangium mesarthrocarpum]